MYSVYNYLFKMMCIFGRMINIVFVFGYNSYLFIDVGDLVVFLNMCLFMVFLIGNFF